MGGCRCSFRNCENSSTTKPGYHFFHYPIRDEERLLKWTKFADKEDFLILPNSVLRNKVICADHFTDKCFMNIKRDRLTKFAVPTLLTLPSGDSLDFSKYGENDDGNNDNIVANISTTNSNSQDQAHNILTETEIFYLENEKSEMEYENVDFIDEPEERGDSDDGNLLLEIESKPKVLNGKKKLSSTLITAAAVKNESNISETTPVKRKTSSNFMFDGNEITLKKIKLPGKKLKPNVVVQKKMNTSFNVNDSENLMFATPNASSTVTISDPIKSKTPEQVENVKKTVVSPKMTTANNKVTSAASSTAFIPYKTTTTEQLENVETIIESYKFTTNTNQASSTNHANQLASIEKTIIEEIHSIGNEMSSFEDKLLKQLDRIENMQKRPIIINQPSVGSSPAVSSGNKIESSTTSGMTKSQLFNGIKKYLNPSMVALLRMEMFSSTERQHKVDEKNLAMELYELEASKVYEYMQDEWRFRLPPKKDVEQWIKERNEAGNGQLEWDDC